MRPEGSPIPAADVPRLLEDLDVGSPVAENDNLLFDARVETPAFADLVSDRIDLVIGTKGSGKSAICRLVAYNADYVLEEMSIVLITGVEIKGDPVFQKFHEQFDRLTETEFENFWRVYLISLVNTHFFENSKTYPDALSRAKKEIEGFRKLARAQGFPMLEKHWTIEGTVAWVLGKIPKGTAIKMKSPEGYEAGVELGKSESQPATVSPTVPLFIAELHKAAVEALEAARVNIWVLLDRLDEVFPQRSRVETVALRALLKTTNSFSSERLRLKIFLRDDIFESITDAEGFPAMTHLQSRASDSLRWDRDQIVQLVVNRVFSNESLRDYFEIDRKRLAVDQRYRADAFYRIFPRKIRGGKNQSALSDWIFEHCQDANGVVAPRDVIDLINFARTRQKEIHNTQPADVATLLSPAAILAGHRKMSERKRQNYLKAEFRHFLPMIERFENEKAEHDEECLRSMFGSEWKKIAKDLKSIGFLKANPSSKTYSIPFLYRQALSVKQGRCRNSVHQGD